MPILEKLHKSEVVLITDHIIFFTTHTKFYLLLVKTVQCMACPRFRCKWANGEGSNMVPTVINVYNGISQVTVDSENVEMDCPLAQLRDGIYFSRMFSDVSSELSILI